MERPGMADALRAAVFPTQLRLPLNFPSCRANRERNGAIPDGHRQVSLPPAGRVRPIVHTFLRTWKFDMDGIRNSGSGYGL
jgi:hypothetical protein